MEPEKPKLCTWPETEALSPGWRERAAARGEVGGLIPGPFLSTQTPSLPARPGHPQTSSDPQRISRCPAVFKLERASEQ